MSMVESVEGYRRKGRRVQQKGKKGTVERTESTAESGGRAP